MATFVHIKRKGKGRPKQATEAQRGRRLYLYFFFNLGARYGWVVDATPRPLYPGKRFCTHCIGGWVGPRVGLGIVR